MMMEIGTPRIHNISPRMYESLSSGDVQVFVDCLSSTFEPAMSDKVPSRPQN